MVLKAIVPILVGAVLIAGGAARAADYRPDEYFGLDLAKAVLSPKRLGPTTTFAPVPVEAKSDARSDASGVLARHDAKKVAIERVKGAPIRTALISPARSDSHVARVQGEKPRVPARTHLAHRHSDPMNAEARDIRIQKWPCNPDMGGICAWQR